jgi:hypothetical protein
MANLKSGLVKFVAKQRVMCYKQLFYRNERIMETSQLKSEISELKARVDNIRDWL